MIQWNTIPFNISQGALFNVPVLPQTLQGTTLPFIPFGSATTQIPALPQVVTPTPQGISSYSNPLASWFNFSLPSFNFPSIKFPTLSFTGAWSGIKSTASRVYNSVSSTISNFGSKIVSTAKKYLGYKESNGSYKKFTNGRSEAWCADYATYVARESGSNIPHFSGVSQILDWGNKNNRFSKTPKIGDLIVFKGVDKKGKRVSHTGVVTDIRNGRVYTTEGNASNSVADRDYALNDSRITGYVSVA